MPESKSQIAGLSQQRVMYVIMDKGHTMIAKGTSRCRFLVRLDDVSNTQRWLLYTSVKIAERVIKEFGFIGDKETISLIPVAVTVTIKELQYDDK